VSAGGGWQPWVLRDAGVDWARIATLGGFGSQRDAIDAALRERHAFEAIDTTRTRNVRAEEGARMHDEGSTWHEIAELLHYPSPAVARAVVLAERAARRDGAS
jgi:hypothetical protein